MDRLTEGHDGRGADLLVRVVGRLQPVGLVHQVDLELARPGLGERPEVSPSKPSPPTITYPLVPTHVAARV